MAINQAVDRTAAGVAEAQFARVATQGSARPSALTALLAAIGSELPPATWPMPSTCSARSTAAIPA